VSVGGSGGVAQPAGASSCGPWQRSNPIGDGTGTTALATIPADIALYAVAWNYYWRDCEPNPPGGQGAWFPDLPPATLAQIARDEVAKLLPRPTINLSPALSVGGFVGLETWLAVTPVGTVSVTAGPLPPIGLSATTTATPVSIEWITGDNTIGTITCPLWGELPPAGADNAGLTAPCGWLPQHPSAAQYGGDRNENFAGQVTIVWDVSWTATNGAGGDLGELRSTTTTSYRVREIQTIGEDR
jgi:enoyl reductase